MKNKNGIIYAGLKVRIFAGIVDFVITSFLSFLVIVFLTSRGMKVEMINQKNETVQISDIKKEDITTDMKFSLEVKTQERLSNITLFITAIYSIYYISSKKQGTPGKQLFKLMVIDKKQGRVNLFTAFLRFISKQITHLLFFIGYLPVLFTEEKVSLHDFLSGTRVVHIKLKEKND